MAVPCKDEDFFQIKAHFPEQLDTTTSIDPYAPYRWKLFSTDTTANTLFKLSRVDNCTACYIHCKEFEDTNKVVTIIPPADRSAGDCDGLGAGDCQVRMETRDPNNKLQLFKVLPPPRSEEAYDESVARSQPEGIVAIYSADKHYKLILDSDNDVVKAVPADNDDNAYCFIFN